MAEINYAKQMSLPGGWTADLDSRTATSQTPDEWGQISRRPLTDDEIRMMTAYYNSPEYTQGKAKSAEQAAADSDTDWGNYLPEALKIAVVGMMTAGAAGLTGGASTAGAGGAFDMGVGLPEWMNSLNASASGASVPWGVNPSVGDWTNMFDFSGNSSPTGGGFQMPAAVPESPAQLAEWGLKEVAPGQWAMPNIPGSASTAADWLSRIASDPKTWGQIAATVLGVVGANQQTEGLQSLSRNFAEYGAPYRARLAESYRDPAGFLAGSPDIKAAVDQGTNATARALSVQGNPAQSGHALQELQNYATTGLYGRLGQERDRLAGFGGLTAYNQAAPAAAVSAVNSEGGPLNAIGAGISQITNPQKNAYQTMREFFEMPGVA